MSIPARTPDCFHVDVFSRPQQLTRQWFVYSPSGSLGLLHMQELTREMRHLSPSSFAARQRTWRRGSHFTMEEELGFAGHLYSAQCGFDAPHVQSTSRSRG